MGWDVTPEGVDLRESCSTRLLGEKMISCRVLSARIQGAPGQASGAFTCKARLAASAACLQYDCSTSKSCRWAAERMERVAVVDLWCKASAVLVLPALMSHLTASEAGDRGAEVEKSTLEGPAKHDGRWRKR
jgi:hypothetical protein